VVVDAQHRTLVIAQALRASFVRVAAFAIAELCPFPHVALL
jgi:predicted TIM-barrel enzyme